MKNIMKRIGKIALTVLGSILALVLLVLGGLNVAKFAIYADYYGMKTDVCINPGLGDDFTCQGICTNEDTKQFLISGYMKDHSASRIYVTNTDNQSYYVTLTKDGKAYMGHLGGIALYGDRVYLSDNHSLLLLSLQSLLTASNGSSVEIDEEIPVNNNADFVYADEQYVYVGEFHNGVQYVADHPYETPDGTQHAIVSRYTHDDLTTPDRIYSICNKVQGICFTPDGKVVMSTSYGLTDSYYYVYNEKEAIDSGKTLDGVPVYYFTNCQKEVKGPAMSEGLDWYEGRVITLTESASNKYIFGKFFFANKIVALDFS